MKALQLILMAFAAAACAAPGHHRASVAPRPTLTADDIAHAPNVSLQQLLLNRVPGLTLSRASDGRLVVHMRSCETPGEEREPLWVVNGIALGDPGNVEAINLRDIATVDVLRDPARLTLYGMRGANGVILITMK